MVRTYKAMEAAIFPFLTALLTEIESAGIDVSGLQMDHICYRVKDMDSYLSIKQLLSAHAELLIEHKINGRLIASYRLFESIVYEKYALNVLELPAPKERSPYASGFEHVEFVVNEPLESFLKKYSTIDWDLTGMNKSVNRDARIRFDSGRSVKFHEQSLLEVIMEEKERFKGSK